MPVTIVRAMIYSMKGEMAYQADYSEGTKVRAVMSRDGWIRREHWKDGEWKPTGKPYIVKSDRKRNGERLIETVYRTVNNPPPSGAAHNLEEMKWNQQQ